MSFYMTCIIILSSHLIKLKTFYTFCSRRQTRLLQFNSFFIICCLRWRTLLSVDDMMENVVNILQKKNLLDNTYIVFSSDNGFHLGEFFCLVWSFLFSVLFLISTSMVHEGLLYLTILITRTLRFVSVTSFEPTKFRLKAAKFIFMSTSGLRPFTLIIALLRSVNCDFVLSRSVFNALRQTAIVRIWCSSAIDDSWTQCVTWEAD